MNRCPNGSYSSVVLITSFVGGILKYTTPLLSATRPAGGKEKQSGKDARYAGTYLA